MVRCMNDTGMYYRITSHGDSPILVSVPHAGGDWDGPDRPERFEERHSQLADLHADLLGRLVARQTHGTMIESSMSRLWCDVERYPDSREEMNGRGMGVVYTMDARQQPLYPDGGGPDGMECERRMSLLYRPYHRMLTSLSRMMLETHAGPVLLCDMHTYPTDPQPYELYADEPRNQIVVGFNAGEPASTHAATILKELLTERRYDVGLNTVFKGAVRPNGVDTDRLACIMVETRRDVAYPNACEIAGLVHDMWGWLCDE